MARIRTIKPEFPQSETIGKLSRDARLLFIQLWTLADDHGRARGASRMLAALLYPYDDDAPQLINTWLFELEQSGCIRRYVVAGDTYLDIPNWGKHQRIDNAGKSRIPECPKDNLAEIRREPPRTAESLDTSPLDLGPRTLGPSTKEKEVSADEAVRAEVLPPELIPDPRKAIFDDGLRWLASTTKRPERALRPLVGKWIKARGDPEVAAALIAAQQNNPVDPISWIQKRLDQNANKKPSDLERRRNQARAFLDFEDGGDSGGSETRGERDTAFAGETLDGLPVEPG